MNEDQYQAIATQAYLLWQQEGRPDGRALEHWITAERQLLSAIDRPADPVPPKIRKKATASKLRTRRKASTQKT